VTAGSFTLALDINGNGKIDANEISTPILINDGTHLATVGDVDAAIEALYNNGQDNVTVAAVTGGFTVTWSSFGNKPPLTPNVRLLTLPKGPFLRITATQLVITIGSVTLTADISFERVGPSLSQVTR